MQSNLLAEDFNQNSTAHLVLLRAFAGVFFEQFVKLVQQRGLLLHFVRIANQEEAPRATSCLELVNLLAAHNEARAEISTVYTLEVLLTKVRDSAAKDS